MSPDQMKGVDGGKRRRQTPMPHLGRDSHSAADAPTSARGQYAIDQMFPETCDHTFLAPGVEVEGPGGTRTCHTPSGSVWEGVAAFRWRMAGSTAWCRSGRPYDDPGREVCSRLGPPARRQGHSPALLRHEYLGRPTVITNSKEGVREVSTIALRWKTAAVRVLQLSSA